MVRYLEQEPHPPTGQILYLSKLQQKKTATKSYETSAPIQR